MKLTYGWNGSLLPLLPDVLISGEPQERNVDVEEAQVQKQPGSDHSENSYSADHKQERDVIAWGGVGNLLQRYGVIGPREPLGPLVMVYEFADGQYRNQNGSRHSSWYAHEEWYVVATSYSKIFIHTQRFIEAEET